MIEAAGVHLAVGILTFAAILYIWRIHRIVCGGFLQLLTESLIAAFIIIALSQILGGIGDALDLAIVDEIGSIILLAAIGMVRIGAYRVARAWKGLQTTSHG